MTTFKKLPIAAPKMNTNMYPNHSGIPRDASNDVSSVICIGCSFDEGVWRLRRKHHKDFGAKREDKHNDHIHRGLISFFWLIYGQPLKPARASHFYRLYPVWLHQSALYNLI